MDGNILLAALLWRALAAALLLASPLALRRLLRHCSAPEREVFYKRSLGSGLSGHVGGV